MEYILKKINMFFFVITFFFISNVALATDEGSENSSDTATEESADTSTIVSDAVDDPFGESLPSEPDPEPEQADANTGSILENIESLEAAMPNVSSIEAYKLLSYMFSGTIIRSNKNSKAIIVAPNQDQYVLAVGDYFSSEEAVVKEISSDEVIVVDQNSEEYFFKIGRTGKKKKSFNNY
jgi:type II secretory pathway component PulC